MPGIESDPANGLDNYDVDDFSDDPFASPPPETTSKKRKEPDSGLGIDEEVDVKKRARVPNVKLDEERFVRIQVLGIKHNINSSEGYLDLKDYRS